MDLFNQQSGEAGMPRNTILLIAGAAGVLVVLGLVVGAIWYFVAKPQGTLSPQELARVEDQLEDAVQNCASSANPEACRQQKIEEAAKSLGAVSVCGMLEGEAYDSCVWETANSLQDGSQCRSIKNADLARSCADDLSIKAALLNTDPSLCDSVQDETRRADCKETSQGPITSANCASRGREASYCADIALYEQAISSRNPDACATILDPDLQGTCYDGVGIPDRDQDGLDASTETQHGTDDTKADTDGDGLSDGDEVNGYGTDPLAADSDGDSFSDGQEVSGGYNPLGEGSLQ